MMTLEEYNENLGQLVEKTGRAMSERIVITSAQRLLGGIHQRVFQNGQDSGGRKIGNYSTTSGYYSPPQFIQKTKLSPIGKTGKKRFASGAPHKSMYLKEGYKELREIQGRETSYVNFEYRGDLEGSLKLGEDETSVLIGFDNQKESKIRKALEVKYRGLENTIFPASEQQISDYSEDVISQLREAEAEILTTVK